MFFRKKRRVEQRCQEIKEKTQRTRQYEQLIHELESAERGRHTHESFKRVDRGMDTRLLTNEEYSRWKTVYSKLYREEFLARQIMDLRRRQHVCNVFRAPPMEIIDALSSFYGSYLAVDEHNHQRVEQELGVSSAEVLQLLKQAVRTYYDEVLLEPGNLEKFDELWKLIRRTRVNRDNGGDLRSLGVEKLPFPSDWNDLVARHYETPAWSTFADLPERGPGQVRLLAAQALRDDDYTQAQIVLSYCNGYPNYRVAVGDVLTAELAKLVTRHRAEVAQNA